MNAAEFNALYEVGIPVFAYPGARPEDIPSARRLVTRTRSKAQPVGLDREGVVWVEGHGAYIALSQVDVVPEDEWQTAKLAAAVATEGALPVPAGPNVSGTVCPVNPPGHDWQNGLTCNWCWGTRTAAEAIVSGLASRRGGDEESARRLLAAYRASVLAEVTR